MTRREFIVRSRWLDLGLDDPKTLREFCKEMHQRTDPRGTVSREERAKRAKQRSSFLTKAKPQQKPKGRQAT